MLIFSLVFAAFASYMLSIKHFFDSDFPLEAEQHVNFESICEMSSKRKINKFVCFIFFGRRLKWGFNELILNIALTYKCNALDAPLFLSLTDGSLSISYRNGKSENDYYDESLVSNVFMVIVIFIGECETCAVVSMA